MTQQNSSSSPNNAAPSHEIALADLAYAGAAETDLDRVILLAESGNLAAAQTLLGQVPLDAPLHNALGVCLLRRGQVEEALDVFRELVLVPGGGWNRPHTPALYKLNFATAYLLNGHFADAHVMLGDVGDEKHPSVVRLRQAMKRWESGLTRWQWMNWRLFLKEPKDCPAMLDFPPGEFVDSHRTRQPAAVPVALRAAS